MYKVIGLDRFFIENFPSSFNDKERAKLKLLYGYEDQDRLIRGYFGTKVYESSVTYICIINSFDGDTIKHSVRLRADSIITKSPIDRTFEQYFDQPSLCDFSIEYERDGLQESILHKLREGFTDEASRAVERIIQDSELLGVFDNLKVYASRELTFEGSKEYPYIWISFIHNDTLLRITRVHFKDSKESVKDYNVSDIRISDRRSKQRVIFDIDIKYGGKYYSSKFPISKSDYLVFVL